MREEGDLEDHQEEGHMMDHKGGGVRGVENEDCVIIGRAQHPPAPSPTPFRRH